MGEKRSGAAESISNGERVMVRVSPALGERIARMAATERRSVSQMVRILVEEALTAREPRQ